MRAWVSFAKKTNANPRYRCMQLIDEAAAYPETSRMNYWYCKYRCPNGSYHRTLKFPFYTNAGGRTPKPILQLGQKQKEWTLLPRLRRVKGHFLALFSSAIII